MKRLKSLDVDEVSLVDVGANKKKFLIFKSKSGSNTMSVNLAKIIKSLRVKKEASEDEKKEAAKKEAAKKSDGDLLPGKDSAVYKEGELSEGAQAALKAVGRILTPFKDEVSDEHVDAVLGELGIKEGAHKESEMEGGLHKEDEGEEKESLKKLFAIPEEVKDEHASEALSKAKEAMDEHLEKLGYRKYGDEELAMKEMEDSVHKSKFAPIFKAHKELVQKNADLEKTINEMKKKEQNKEIVQKAASFKHLGLKSEDVVDVLTSAREVGEKHYEKVCKQYEALNEQAQKGGLFKEIGSKLPNNGASDVEARIDAAVNSIVQKSANSVTKEQAYDSFMATDEGKKLYVEMKNSRPNGI